MENTKDIEVLKVEVGTMVQQVNDVSIKNEEDFNKAAALLTGIKKFKKFVTGKKEDITKPMNESLKNIRQLFAPLEDQVETAEKKLVTLVTAWHDKVEAERQRKEASIAARAEKGQLKEETAVQKMEELGTTQKQVVTDGGSIGFSKVKDFRVVNEHMVPDAYWKLDMVSLRRDALAIGKIGMVIPGVEVFEKTQIGGRV